MVPDSLSPETINMPVNYKHWIFRIDTRDDQFAFDLTGNQYGYDDPVVMPLREYMTSKGISTEDTVEDSLLGLGDDELYPATVESNDDFRKLVEQKAVDLILTMIENYRSKRETIWSLLWGPQSDYVAASLELLERISRALDGLWTRMHDLRVGYLYRYHGMSFAKIGFSETTRHYVRNF